MGDFQHFIDQEVAFTNGEDSWVGDGERQSTDEVYYDGRKKIHSFDGVY